MKIVFKDNSTGQVLLEIPKGVVPNRHERVIIAGKNYLVQRLIFNYDVHEVQVDVEQI